MVPVRNPWRRQPPGSPSTPSPGTTSAAVLYGYQADRIPDPVPSKAAQARTTLLGHSSVAVTSSVYGHLTAEDARAALEKAGWLSGKQVSW